MMKLSDVLKLNKDAESLNIIQEYLEKSLSYHDYVKESTYYLEIAQSLELYELVYEHGNETINKFENQRPTSNHQKIYECLFNAALRLEKYKEAKDYIQKRRSD